jgi:hypothetical protein
MCWRERTCLRCLRDEVEARVKAEMWVSGD